MRGIPLIIALVYGILLVYLIPVEAVLDRQNYLNSAQNGWSDLILLGYINEGFIKVIVNEPIWLLLNISLSKLLEPDLIIQVFVFVPAFLTAFILVNKHKENLFFILIILLFPQVIKNNIIHLRQGIAIMVFLISSFTKNKKAKYILLGITPFIHSSFFIVILLKIYIYIIERIKLKFHLKIYLTAMLSLTLGIFILILAGFFGATQAGVYTDVKYEVSGIAFIFWSFILMIYFWEGKTYGNKYFFVIASVILYLSTYFLTPVTARVFESSLTLVLVSGINMKEIRKNMFLTLVILNMLYFYLANFSEPFFGWQSIDI